MSKEQAFYARSHPIEGEDVDISADDFTCTVAGSIYVGTGGDVKVITLGGSTLTYKNVPNAYTIAAQIKTVVKTGTTAADMINQYTS